MVLPCYILIMPPQQMFYTSQEVALLSKKTYKALFHSLPLSPATVPIQHSKVCTVLQYPTHRVSIPM